jgi:hypothetical protein
MTTRFDPDPELLDIVRRADPLLDPRIHFEAGLDTESALLRLAPDLDRPLAPGGASRRRRRALRVAVLAGAVVAAGFAVANVASTGNGAAVSPAQARTIIKRARAALVLPPGAILEEDDVTRVTARDGSTFTSEAHQWTSTSPPYDNRAITIQNGKLEWDQAIVNGRLDLYDPATNTVYLAPPSAPQQTPIDPDVNSALGEVRYLLGQSSVTVNPNASVDGAPAIEFTSDGGRFSYWASPGDYRPLQSEDRQDSLPDGRRGVGITRYPIERVLRGPAASRSLFSLQAQHPSATVDHSSADYQAVLWRLFHERLHPAPPA